MRKAVYNIQSGKSCPTEILEALAAFHAEGRPIWKPMHLQPIYQGNAFVTINGSSRGNSNAYIKRKETMDVSSDIFERGICLPSDIKMTVEQQDTIIEVIRRCFKGSF
jgi:dTDP-4-amino-4,6-dideoxygalactose transaminase